MKKIFALVMMAMVATTTFAQSAAQLVKEAKANNKVFASVANMKPTKAAKAEAKNLKKKGYEVPIGETSLEQQLTRCQLMQEELIKDPYGNVVKRYNMQTGRATSGSYNVAFAAARTAAMAELASQLQSSIVAAFQDKFANKQTSMGETISSETFNQSLKGVIDQNMKGVVPIMTAYRELEGGKFDVQVRMAFDKTELMNSIRTQLLKDLEKEGDVLDSLVEDILCGKF